MPHVGRQRPGVACTANELVEGSLIGPGQDVALALSAAQVGLVKLQVVGSRLDAVLCFKEIVDDLESGFLGLLGQFSLWAWLVDALLDLFEERL